MYKEVYFDHTYTEDCNYKFLKRLAPFGFSVDDVMREHPGKVFCKFLKIGGRYLEFVHIKKSGTSVNKPGFSFGAHDLKKYEKKLRKKSYFEIDYYHKNYDWKENNTDYLPGWNYLTFKKTNIRSFYPWFTEYGPHPKKKKILKSPRHPNGVQSIYGAEFQVNQSGRDFFECLLGEKLSERVVLPDGFVMYFKFTERSNRYLSVILKSSNIDKTISYMPKEKFVEFKGNKSVKLHDSHSKSRMWDIVII